jgi:hypothetical protein
MPNPADEEAFIEDFNELFNDQLASTNDRNWYSNCGIRACSSSTNH